MARLANGDPTGAVDLYTYYFRQIAGTVRRRALHMGHDLRADDVQDLVWSTTKLLARRARGWNGDGATPWAWAARGIDALIAQHVGPSRASQGADDLQIEVPPRPLVDRAKSDNAISLIRALAINNDLVAMLDEALTLADTPRNGAVFAEHLVQQALGDPSPAETVARITGLKPPAVRQIVCRARDRLRLTVGRDDRFNAIAHIALLQPPPSRPHRLRTEVAP